MVTQAASNRTVYGTYYGTLHTLRGSNIFFQIMVTFLSYISNACHSLSGVAERLQHTLRT